MIVHPFEHGAALADNCASRRARLVCARFTMRKKKLRQIADELEAGLAPDDEALFRPCYNVAPTDLAWIVDLPGGDRRVLRPAK